MRLGTALAAAGAFVLTAAHAAGAEGRFDAPRVDQDRLVWPVRAAVAAPRDTAALVAEAARRPALVAYALRLSAPRRLARGDTTGADSAWAALAGLDSPWAWEAVRARCDLRAGDPARADSLLAAASGVRFTPLDRAAWLVRRARARLASGDSTGAFRFALEAVHGDPTMPPAATALALAEALAAAGAGSLTEADHVAAADVEARNGSPREAAARLEALMARAPSRTAELHLRIADQYRGARQWARAEHALGRALQEAGTPAARARIWLERARVDAVRWRTGSARDAAETAIAADPGGPYAATAAVEAAIARERLGDLDGARGDWMTATRAGAGGDAALRAALLWLAAGRPDSARAWLGGDDEVALFWRGVLERRRDRRAGDSLLRIVAMRPGYTFHRVAARESVGTSTWPGAVAAPGCAGDGCGKLALAEGLAEIGADEEALRVLHRWAT